MLNIGLCCRRYEKAQKPLSAFDADISKYADLSEEVLAENAAESIKFLFVDCGPLKQVMLVSKDVSVLVIAPSMPSHAAWGLDDDLDPSLQANSADASLF